jgi:signal peptidase II
VKAPAFRLLLAVLVCGTIGCDRVTKAVAAARLSGTPRQSFLGDTVRLEYVENSGAFLSLGANLPPWARVGLFTVGTGLLLAGLAVAVLRGRFRGRLLAGLCLLLAGGTSNLADRLLQGAVVDFVNLGLGPVRTGIFNVADVAIMAGVALFLSGNAVAGRR